MKTVMFLLGLSALLLSSITAQAGVPRLLNYQGKLTTAQGGCVDTNVQITFSIYPDSLSVDPLWTEVQSHVQVKDEVFSVLLGSVDSIPESVFTGDIRYLGVKVEQDSEMRPLKPMVSVAYAYRANTVINPSIDPTTRYHTIPATAFQVLHDLGASNAVTRGFYETNSRFGFQPDHRVAAVSAPIQLPHGATTSRAVAYYRYEHESIPVTVEAKVGRVPLFERPDDFHCEAMGSTSVVAANSVNYDSLTISSFSDSAIDNTAYCYTITVKGTSDDGYFRIYHARVEYIIDNSLP